MVTRKVQVTGGSTYTVSLPKSWATEQEITAGTEVELHPEGESLLLVPHRQRGRSEGKIDITNIRGADLARAVVTMYVSGFDLIRLETISVDPDQRRIIRDATQSLVGLEVIEESGEHVLLQDLLDSSELSIHNATTRMRLIALTMLDDAVRSVATGDTDLSADVVARDDDVDRLWFMVSRVFRSVLRDPGAAATLGMSREVCFDYHSSARQLERIADHSVKIATLSQELEDVPGDISDAIEALHSAARLIIEEAMDALLEDDSSEATRLANDARDKVTAIDDHTRSIDELIREHADPVQAQLLGLIVDSLSRTADYGGNIAETALQMAAPRPS